MEIHVNILIFCLLTSTLTTMKNCRRNLTVLRDSMTPAKCDQCSFFLSDTPPLHIGYPTHSPPQHAKQQGKYPSLFSQNKFHFIQQF